MGLPWGCGHPSLTSHARGLLTSFVTLLLLWLGSAQLRVEGPGQPVTATVGQDVVLPCHLSPQRNARSLEVRWIRNHISETVHHYCNGQDLYGEQMGAYAGRTELVRAGLSAGSLDLRITGLRTSDDGQYVCIVKDGDAYYEATVKLVVSDPFFLNAQTWMVAMAVVIVLLPVSTGLGVYLFRKQAARIQELVQKLVEQAAELDEYRAKAVQQSARLKDLTADLLRKDTELEEQEAELEEKNARLAHKSARLQDLTAVLVRKNKERKEQAAELAELAAELEEKNARLERQSERLQEQEAELVSKDTELEEQAAELAELKAERVQKDKRLSELKAERVQKDKRLAELAAELEKKNARLAHQSARLKDLSAELVRKNKEHKEQEAELVRKDSELEEQAAELAQKDKRLVELAAEREEKNASLAQQSARLKDLSVELVRKNKERKEQAAELVQKNKRLVELAAEREKKNARLAHQSARLKDLTVELVRKNKELKEQAAELAELKAELEEKNASLAHQSARLHELATELEKKDAKLREQSAGQAWRKFLLPHYTVKVTLDPDTAHPMLVVSQDNSSVRRETERQQVPDTPERFDTSCCVLGREEFREGRYCWLVEVEGEGLKHSGWAMGVARASVERKKWINMSPEEGIWAVEYCYENLKSLKSPPTPLSLSPVPTRIWVCLDCTEGQVSFINHDNRVEMFTFTNVFLKGESMRPWFWLGTDGIQLCLRDSTL